MSKDKRLSTLLKQAKSIAEGKIALSVNSPDTVAALVMADMADLEQEELWVILLNARNERIDTVKLYKGTLMSSAVRINELFREAIRQNAAGIVVVHNHPSGDPTPSLEDIEITKEMAKAGRLLNLEVLDHIVIGRGRYVSLRSKDESLFPALGMDKRNPARNQEKMA